jgi:putative SOS response-associated peptidase YedK
MCGRLSKAEKAKLDAWLERKAYRNSLEASDTERRINTAPTDLIDVVSDQRQLELIGWSMPLFDPNNGIRLKMSTFNAKVENLQYDRIWKTLIGRPYVIVAEGFYEWKKLDPKGKTKQPYFIHSKDQPLTFFAGLYNVVKHASTGEWIKGATIITRPPNEFMKQIHNRMPQMLTDEEEDIKELSWKSDQNFYILFQKMHLRLSPLRRSGDDAEYPTLFC